MFPPDSLGLFHSQHFESYHQYQKLLQKFCLQEFHSLKLRALVLGKLQTGNCWAELLKPCLKKPKILLISFVNSAPGNYFPNTKKYGKSEFSSVFSTQKFYSLENVFFQTL